MLSCQRPPWRAGHAAAGTVASVPDPFDSIVLLSFGGPEAPDEVMPFLRRVTAGRGIPDDRLAEVADHYFHFGGISPINGQNRALVAALQDELAGRGVTVPVRLANRNSPPYVVDVLADLAPGPVLVLLTSPYQSYSSCRQYREDLGTAAADLARSGATITLAKVPPYAAHPAFRATVTRLTLATIDEALAEAPVGKLALVSVAHSIPMTADAASGPASAGGQAYSGALRTLANELAGAATRHTGRDLAGDLAWCSRSGPPQIPWLEPDIGDRLEELARAGVDTVVMAPIGFVSDHMEVQFDLDTEARQRADDLGIRLYRAPTVGTDPQFVAGLADLLLDRAAEARGEPAPALVGLPPADCAPDCCRTPRSTRPTACPAEETSDVA